MLQLNTVELKWRSHTAIKRQTRQTIHQCAATITAALYFFATFGLRAIDSYLAKAKLQASPSLGDSWTDAFKNVDFYDAAVTGVVTAATLGAGTEISLARSTVSAVARRLTTVETVAAVVKASSDYTIKKGTKSVMNNSKNGVDAGLDFAFDIIGAKSTSGLLDGSKRSIVNCFEKIKQANTMAPAEREVYKKVMKVVKSDKTKKAVETLAGYTSST